MDADEIVFVNSKVLISMDYQVISTRTASGGVDLEIFGLIVKEFSDHEGNITTVSQFIECFS